MAKEKFLQTLAEIPGVFKRPEKLIETPAAQFSGFLREKQAEFAKNGDSGKAMLAGAAAATVEEIFLEGKGSIHREGSDALARATNTTMRNNVHKPPEDKQEKKEEVGAKNMPQDSSGSKKDKEDTDSSTITTTPGLGASK